MKSSLVTLLVFFTTSICGDQLFTFRGAPYNTGRPEPHEHHKSRKMICVTDNPSNAIVWNTNLKWKNLNLAISDGNRTDEAELHFNAHLVRRNGSNVTLDLNSWLQYGHDWTTVNSLDEPMGPVFDSRWEAFQEYETVHSPKEDFKYVTTFGDTGAVVVSVRGAATADFLLCNHQDYASHFCYWITIGALNNTATQVRKCVNGTGSRRHSCDLIHTQDTKHVALSVYEWRTFLIKWTAKVSTIEMYDSRKLILTCVDPKYPTITNNEFLQKYHVFFNNQRDQAPMLYRFHSYNYTVVKDPKAELRSPPMHFNASKTMCIEILAGLCFHCKLEVKMLDKSAQVLASAFIYGRSAFQKASYDLPMWQNAKIRFANVSKQAIPITLQIITKLAATTDDREYHWAIGNVQQCWSEGTVKKISMVATQDFDTKLSKYTWPRLTCQEFSYNDTKTKIINSNNPVAFVTRFSAHLNQRHLCPANHFGPHCAMLCKDHFTNDCINVAMCDERSCNCMQGIRGETCNSRCPPGLYGYGCSEICGNCVPTDLGTPCNIYTGTCTKCQVFLNSYFSPPYCKTRIRSPPRPLVKYVLKNSMQLYLPVLEEYKAFNASFTFELMENKNKSYQQLRAEESVDPMAKSLKVYAATFENLQAGAEYSVRMLINVTPASTKLSHKVLEGEWGYVTTLCQRSSSFTIVSHERSLTVRESSNPGISDQCMDTLYFVKLFSTSPQLKLIKIEVHRNAKHGVNFLNLTPDTEFEIQVIDTNGNLHFKQRTQTLKATTHTEGVKKLEDRPIEAPNVLQNITWDELKNGSVDLKWYYAWEMDEPVKYFRIKAEILYTNLDERWQSSENALVVDIPIKNQLPVYTARIRLMPSTSYKIHIEAMDKSPKNVGTVDILTSSALAFGFVQQPVVNENQTQIGVVIPTIVNNTKRSQIDIIVAGSSTCKESEIMKNCYLQEVRGFESSDVTWRIATFLTTETLNKSFTIGDGKIYDDMVNCPLLGGTYVIGFVVYENTSGTCKIPVKPIVWKFDPIQIGPPLKIPREAWAVPLAVVLVATIGFAICYFRRKGKNN